MKPVLILVLLFWILACRTKVNQIETYDLRATEGPWDVEDGERGQEDERPFEETVNPSEPLLAYVNPFIGTGGEGANVGSALPGATAPFGLVKVSPDTLDPFGNPITYMHCAGYSYTDHLMYGFSHNHLHGTGAPDYGNVLVTPTVGMDETKTSKRTFFLPFTHEGEEASPGYYAVTITSPPIRAEVTASVRCAHHRYTFLGLDPKKQEATIVINGAAALLDGRSLGGEVSISSQGRLITGFNHNLGVFSGRYGGFPVFFVARFSRLPKAFGVWADGVMEEGGTYASSSKDGAEFGAWAGFELSGEPVVELQVCLSYVDVEGALRNMEAEMPSFDFEKERREVEEAWERELQRFEVYGGSEQEKVLFYTALYHVLQMPTIWTDVDGRYRGFDNRVHKAEGFIYYTDMSLWDTFRTLHPLLTLVYPERQRDMMRSLAAMQAQGGFVPKWPMGMGDTESMIGQHGATVVADTYLKGITDFEVEALYLSMKEAANAESPPGSYGGRDCFPWYILPDYGYCPADRTEDSVSKTLEYAFNDYCLSRLAKALGFFDDADLFFLRSSNYKNVFDEESGFFRPRKEDGSFVEPFNPEWWSEGYTEGSAWQWLWFVPHDQKGLMALLGGKEAFVAKLEKFFTLAKENFSFFFPTGFYFHGNEPDLHAAFLFVEAGRPDLAKTWSRWALEANYKPTWNGMVGNDDGGTLSAWYVFVASGLFPWPCFPGYYVTSPIFDRVVWHLPHGDLIIVRSKEAEVPTWNGQPLEGHWLDHFEVIKGGTLEVPF